MANMSYCRFENTLIDFRDCLEALREDGLECVGSQREADAMDSLAASARKFLALYEEAQHLSELDRLGLLPE